MGQRTSRDVTAEGAQRTVDFMTYIYRTGDIADRFAEALADRGRDGVRVRVLLDAFGSRPIDRALAADLRGAGATARSDR